jgi:hypothetical protein
VEIGNMPVRPAISQNSSLSRHSIRNISRSWTCQPNSISKR